MGKYAVRRPKTTYKRSFKRTTRKPYGDRYGNDAFVKVEAINNLSTIPSSGG